MSAGTNSIALLVLLDAFRPDYLGRTEFLRDLARRAAVGAMEEPFGFLPRAAYFGGLTPNETGYSNIFAREPWKSPFPSIPGMDYVLAHGDELAIRNRIVAEAPMRIPDFGSRYVEGFALPVRELTSYAIAETEPPWGPRCGYRSLFHILDEVGLPWVQCSWPYTRVVAAADPGIVANLLDQLTEDTRFGFVHLSQLDAVGHESGPGSTAMRDALVEIDRSCALLHARAHEKFDRVRILFFGDHGMVTVVRTIDLLAELRAADLEPGREFEMFVDSPMARFWFQGSASRDAVAEVLDRFEFGRVLSTDDLARYGADRMQPGNGELFFAAHTGVVFSPNAFQGEAVQVRGMHGYLPDVPDNRGLLLLYDSADRTPRSLGVAQATQLFPTCLHLCDLDPTEYTPLPRLHAEPAPLRWTRDGIPAHEARVEHDFARAKATLMAHAPASAVVVTGSFGRGEGGVVRGPRGLEVLNDYDFAVIGYDAIQALGLGPSLASTLGTDFCDVMPFSQAADLPSSQLHFDLRYGSRVLAGDGRVLDRLPRYAPADISVRDAALLLMNRIAGVMLVPLPEQRGAPAGLTQFGVNQLAKALIAVGDAVLIAIADYSTRCADRARRFAALAPALGIDRRIADTIDRAYCYKVDPVPAPGPFGPSDFIDVRAAVAAALGSLTAQAAAGVSGWETGVSAGLAPVQSAAADNRLAVDRLCAIGFRPADVAESTEPVIRRAILEGLALVFRATGGDVMAKADWALVQERLTCIGAPTDGLTRTSAARDEVARQRLSAAWLAVCH